METNPTARPGDYIYRTATALAVGRVRPGGEADYLREREKAGDKITAMLTRAASVPISTTALAAVGQSIVIDFLQNLAPASAGGALIARTLNLRGNMDGQYGATLPAFAPRAAAGAFVAESQPIPVEQFVVSGPSLILRKLGMISALTQEMASGTNSEALIRQVMTDSAALTLDTVLFGNSAATDAAPAGLLNGVTPVTATTGGGDNALRMDMYKLMAALAVGVRSNVVLIARPETALKMQLAGIDVPFDVLPTECIAEGTVIAVGIPGLVFAADDVPKVDVSAEAVLHMEDGTPLPLSATGSPNTVAAPVYSMFQTAQLAIRLILDIGWATRTAGTVAVVTGVTW